MTAEDTRAARNEFDDLAAAAKADPTETFLEPLYRATFGLDRWYFAAVGTFPNLRAFCGKVDDVGYVMAFTARDRAEHYAQVQGIVPDGSRPPILALPIDEAVRHCISQQRIGATGVLFDDGWGNWRFPLQDLPRFHAHFGATPDADAD